MSVSTSSTPDTVSGGVDGKSSPTESDIGISMGSHHQSNKQEIRGISRQEFSQRIQYLIGKVDSLNHKLDQMVESIKQRRDRSRSSSPVSQFSSRTFLDV